LSETNELLTAVRQRARANLFWQHLGVEVEDAREGWVRLRVRVRPELCNAAGAPVHGGLYAALVDMAVGGALGTTRESSAGGVDQSTLDLNVSFLAAARDGELVAEGRIIRRGRTVAFGETTISDTTGRVLAVGRATYLLLAPRKEGA
jgi:acyl-CoA thioesterase